LCIIQDDRVKIDLYSGWTLQQKLAYTCSYVFYPDSEMTNIRPYYLMSRVWSKYSKYWCFLDRRGRELEILSTSSEHVNPFTRNVATCIILIISMYFYIRCWSHVFIRYNSLRMIRSGIIIFLYNIVHLWFQL
jgi:hypothetical protein